MESPQAWNSEEPRKAWPAADAAGAFLGMVDDDDAEGVSSLQFALIGEQRRHVAAGVFVDPMETDKSRP